MKIRRVPWKRGGGGLKIGKVFPKKFLDILVAKACARESKHAGAFLRARAPLVLLLLEYNHPLGQRADIIPGYNVMHRTLWL